MFTLHYCISQVELLVVYAGSKQLKTCTDQLVHIEKDLKKFQSVYHEVFSSIEKVIETFRQLQRARASALCTCV